MKMGSMLINFNNGTGSRFSDHSEGPRGKRAEVTDFLHMCLDSYFASVQTDMPFVIIDDGSTDDGPEIISKYESRLAHYVRNEKNAGLTPAMEEAADILIDKHGCDIICRFDGDMEFLTPGWDRRFIQHFENSPQTGAVGGCQLVPYGAIWALGDMLIHPDGYVHVLGHPRQGPVRGFTPVMMSEQLVLGNVECDSVMGCLAAFRVDAYKKAGRLRTEFTDLRGETEDLNLRLMLEGYQSIALGSVSFIHRHMEHRKKEESIYDTGDKVKESYTLWEDLWGWNKLAPDLSAIYERWQGTPLVRNLIKNPDGSIEYIGP